MDDTEESRKAIQEYQNQLKDAETSLKETEWSRFISETENLLDDLYSDYEETLNARLDNIDTLFADVINDANANANKINDTINSVAKSVGYSISLLDKTAQEIKNTIKKQTTNEVQTPKGDTYVDEYSGVGLNGVTGDSSNAGKGVEADIKVIVNNLLPGGKIDYSKIDLSKLKRYAKGGKITKDQLAWTQEDGTELIYRASDGAMLTPLGKGMVFTHEMSENLWEMAQGNMPNLVSNIKLPTVAPNSIKTVNNENTISINLPNVTNYNDFKNALQKDSKFVGFMQEVTLGQMMGKNSLNKNKY